MATFQILIENNTAYITYLAFNQMMMGFSFNFADKIWFCFCVFFFGIVFIYSICFFLITDYHYGKLAQYFIHEMFRTFPCLCILTVKITVRGFLKGVVHSTLHHHYGWEMLCLSFIEILVIALVIFSEVRYQAYLTRTHWLFNTLYHFNFIMLHILLYVEEINKGVDLEMQRLANSLENYVLVVHSALFIIQVVLNFVPISLLMIKLQSLEE